MKRLLFAIVLFFVFLLSFSSAQTTCSADDTILRLSAATNAHGEIPGNTNYGTEICYSATFGVPALTAPISRTCSGNNKVVRLSSTTNAHGEIPGNTNYGTEICYQGLSCHSVAGNVVCPSGEQEILHLSGATNAHLELGTGTAYASASNYKICCSNAAANVLTNAEWRDLNNIPIITPPPVCVNQWVNAHIAAAGVADGALVNVILGESDCLTNPPTVSCSTPLSSVVPVAVHNNQADIPFQITPAMFAAGAGGEAPGSPEEEFYFGAQLQSGGPTITSNILYVSNDPTQCAYQPPTAAITAPVHRGVYFRNTNINFISGCSSSAGPLTYNWEVSQGGQPISLGASQTLGTFQYNFANTGQALVRLTCTDTVSGLSATAESQILVVASPFTFAYINSPPLNGVLYNQPPVSGQPYFPREAHFSASDSFTVDASGSTCTVTCLSGNCPTETKNSPSTCTGNVPGSPTLGQAGGALTITGTPLPYTSMNFDWTFWDNNWNEPWNGPNQEGSGVYSGTVSYDDMSNSINDKHMSVTATYPATGSSTSTATFQRDFTLGRCLNNKNTYLSPNGQQQATTGASAVPNACRGSDTSSPLDDCCPAGQVCAADSNNNYFCAISPNPASKCEDFGQTDCSNWANINPQAPSNSYGPVNDSCTYIECYWITSGTNVNTCGVRDRHYSQNANGGCDVTLPPVSSCIWTTTQTACENGHKTITYTGTGSPPSSCVRDPVIVPCGGLNFELGFFDYTQFIAAAIVIALIYVASGIRRRKL